MIEVGSLVYMKGIGEEPRTIDVGFVCEVADKILSHGFEEYRIRWQKKVWINGWYRDDEVCEVTKEND